MAFEGGEEDLVELGGVRWGRGRGGWGDGVDFGGAGEEDVGLGGAGGEAIALNGPVGVGGQGVEKLGDPGVGVCGTGWVGLGQGGLGDRHADRDRPSHLISSQIRAKAAAGSSAWVMGRPITK